MARFIFAAILLTLGLGVASAHDHERPGADGWYASLKVPNDGLALSKGINCCNKLDCKQRPVRMISKGLYETIDDNGHLLRFTSRATITDPVVRRNNPYPMRATICIWRGEVVCHVPASAGI